MLHWWGNYQKTSLMVSIASEMCDLYPDQHIVAVGHSPSWLVYTIAEVRKARGEAPNVSFVPYSGSAWQVVDHRPNDDQSHSEVTYERAQHANYKPSALCEYFSHLNKTQHDQLTIQSIPTSDKKTVLVDLANNGNGFASFVEVLAHKHGSLLEQRFHAHLFKTYYSDRTLQIILEQDNGQNTTLSATVQCGAAGMLLDALSGSKGTLTGSSSKSDEMVGRFMPCFNPHIDTKIEKTGFANATDIASIKAQIKKAILRIHTEEGRAMLSENRIALEARAPEALHTWSNAFMMHGGGMFPVPTPRERERADQARKATKSEVAKIKVA